MWTLVLLVLGALGESNGIAKKDLDMYTSRVGNILFNFSRTVTRYRDLHKRFDMSESKVVPIDLDEIFADVAKQMNESLRKKVDAIEKLMLFAEEKALDQNNSTSEVTLKVDFPQSKSLNVSLTMDDHFQTKVNTGLSSVHVPTSIYDQDQDVLEAVTWSEDLDASFKSNYKENPTLSWQYFGSATGILRHYPARKWPKGDVDSDENNQDLYDCRVRPWYVGAANSPKNIVILQDVSGSMTGLRSQIAKRVIFTILDTLMENDYVNVYNFSQKIIPLVDCFTDHLVQANLENVREFKIALEQGQTHHFAETYAAFVSAFNLLEDNFNKESSAQCNQAIMIITDGSSEYYKELFNNRNPLKRIRLFTFLIGREVTDFREVLWMACYNKGYYTHISTLGEVQSEVLKYLPVMSRPLVMSEKHHVAWTPSYADMAEIVESDWQWEEKTKIKQKTRSDRYKNFYQIYLAAKRNNGTLVAEFTTQEQMEEASRSDKVPALVYSKVKSFLDHGQTNITRYRWSRFDRQFRFVISASIPVFDKRKTYGNERIANFLGVVGTDIPITELQKLSSPFLLGVNGYAFAITNNGYIVFHPDWRPLYDDILRPNYNTVDLTEVELVDSDDYKRNRHPKIIALRTAMVNSGFQNSTKTNFTVRRHGDDFKRVKVRLQEYKYGKIEGTIYTLGLSIPLNANRFIGVVEVWRRWKDRKSNANATKYFEPTNPGHKWQLNPNWSYCEYIGSSNSKFNENKEELLLHFLQRIQESNYSWAWTATNVSKPYMCDKFLVQSLVFDAELTQKFAIEENSLRSLILGNSTVMTFVATRSGLTRWVNWADFIEHDNPFLPFYGRATDEIWYKRTVDWNEIDEEIFVFSVPFDAGTRNFAHITATQAIFVKKEGLKAPVAVVGILFDMDKFMGFLNFSSPPIMKGRGETFPRNICQGEEFDCFFLDDNGFIIISEDRDEIGQFFGEADGKLMEVLLKAGIYEEIAVTDFQAVCEHPLNRSNFADILATPFTHLKLLFNWLLGHLAWLILKLNLHFFINPDYVSVLADYSESEEMQDGEGNMPFIREAYVNKTKLRPCDRKYKLYTFGTDYINSSRTYHRSHDTCHQKCDDFLSAQRIPHTNLLLVVVQAKCRCGNYKIQIEGSEIEYPMHPNFVNKTKGNPILLELCRIPYDPLPRKRLSYCYDFDPEESDMKEDCGSISSRVNCSFFWILGAILVQYCVTKHYNSH